MTRERFWVWFGPIVLGELVGQLFDVTLLDYVFKPILVPALLLYLYLNTRNAGTAFTRLVGAGLSFSWLGDVILLFSDRSELFFAAGLGAFLIAHLFYIAAYIRSVRGAPGEAFFRRRPGWLLPFLLLFAGLYGLLYPALGSMRIPVLFYTATILLMAVVALNRKYRVSEASFYPIFVGVLLFILSDSLLAFNKFLVPLPYSGVFVMSTYIAAQYLIVEGAIARA
ncbi:MAG: lysoplasmalogenase [Anaerolineae bacterium]|jgi:uncharacterized membrane protein YhhN